MNTMKDKLQKLKKWAFKNTDVKDYKEVFAVAVVVLVAAAALFIYQHMYHVYQSEHQLEKQMDQVTVLPQQEAESVAGVEKAAAKADVPVSMSQTKEIVTQIKEIRTTEQVPVYVVKSTGATVEKDITTAKEQAKADFTIVTDKDNPAKTVDLENLDKDAEITLNQYNIKAYPKALRQIEVGRGTDGGTFVGVSISKKVTDNGQYLGVGVDYDTERDMVMAKVIYTW